jgi:nicotinamidase-related amidase
MRWFYLSGAVFFLAVGIEFRLRAAEPAAKMLTLHTRQQIPTKGAGKGSPGAPVEKPQPAPEGAYQVVEKTVEWDPRHTALVVVDMWDDHWCRGAAKRVAELAGPMNRLIDEQRGRGVLIIHAPSTTVGFYKDTPQRKRAQAAQYSKPPVPLATSPRWGTAWCWPDAEREPELPIDDTDMGCDCAQKCSIREAWTRQIATIEIKQPDAISDNGQEVYNLLQQYDIDRVIILGVHLNMCVLGRPFGIRQLSYLGKQVALVRDMTDTMYNSQKRPQVDHFSGTDLVIGHVEQHWCPTICSTDLVDGKPFRFQEDRRP